MIGRTLVGAGVLAVSACTTLGPDFETPDADLLETWDEQAQSLSAGQAPENWWASFNDPVLDQLVKMGCIPIMSLNAIRVNLEFVKH